MSEPAFQNGDLVSPTSFENPVTGGEMPTVHGIRSWLLEGLSEGATHTIVWCDTYDHSDYPEHVMPGQDVKELIEKQDGKNMQKLMEVYWLAGDLEEQLAMDRSFTYGPKEI